MYIGGLMLCFLLSAICEFSTHNPVFLWERPLFISVPGLSKSDGSQWVSEWVSESQSQKMKKMKNDGEKYYLAIKVN